MAPEIILLHIPREDLIDWQAKKIDDEQFHLRSTGTWSIAFCIATHAEVGTFFHLANQRQAPLLAMTSLLDKPIRVRPRSELGFRTFDLPLGHPAIHTVQTFDGATSNMIQNALTLIFKRQGLMSMR